ncbi:hypothetical protein TrVE_jg9779 [Triparma verrucosa]|uniref:MPN domain-containing protein n=1 Tax=Triparma verrucosa TaxID=1606542 RepID=A0A9W7B2Z7_9STRA|nr:hypothetical protein TrVE_jg9779 [Triparma verrucosa]
MAGTNNPNVPLDATGQQSEGNNNPVQQMQMGHAMWPPLASVPPLSMFPDQPHSHSQPPPSQLTHQHLQQHQQNYQEATVQEQYVQQYNLTQQQQQALARKQNLPQHNPQHNPQHHPQHLPHPNQEGAVLMPMPLPPPSNPSQIPPQHPNNAPPPFPPLPDSYSHLHLPAPCHPGFAPRHPFTDVKSKGHWPVLIFGNEVYPPLLCTTFVSMEVARSVPKEIASRFKQLSKSESHLPPPSRTLLVLYLATLEWNTVSPLLVLPWSSLPSVLSHHRKIISIFKASNSEMEMVEATFGFFCRAAKDAQEIARDGWVCIPEVLKRVMEGFQPEGYFSQPAIANTELPKAKPKRKPKAKSKSKSSKQLPTCSTGPELSKQTVPTQKSRPTRSSRTSQIVTTPQPTSIPVSRSSRKRNKSNLVLEAEASLLYQKQTAEDRKAAAAKALLDREKARIKREKEKEEEEKRKAEKVKQRERRERKKVEEEESKRRKKEEAAKEKAEEVTSKSKRRSRSDSKASDKKEEPLKSNTSSTNVKEPRPPTPPPPNKNCICGPDQPLSELWQQPPTEISPNVILGRDAIWSEGYYHNSVPPNPSSSPSRNPPLSSCLGSPGACFATCNCGLPSSRGITRDHRKTANAGPLKSAKASVIVHELKKGTLNPHTLIACENYIGGPEMRFMGKNPILHQGMSSVVHAKGSRGYVVMDSEADVEAAELKESDVFTLGQNVGLYSIQPFDVVVSPDVGFMTDLHSHLMMCEVIGFLAGKYDPIEKTIYIQAAFPCVATVRDDSGGTDVEMCPVSQIVVRDAILQHGMEVVGWYHNHPAFQPDPSVTDIENQTDHQKLVAASIENLSKDVRAGTTFSKARGSKTNIVPFVGLIVGTYDPNVEEAESIMRWFHSKPHGSMQCEFPMNLQVTYREYRRELEEGQSREELAASGVALRRERRKKVLQDLYSSTKTGSMTEHSLKKMGEIAKQERKDRERKEIKKEEEKEFFGGELVQIMDDHGGSDDYFLPANSPPPPPCEGSDRIVNRDNTRSPMTPIPDISTSNVTTPPPSSMGGDAGLTPFVQEPVPQPAPAMVFCEEATGSIIERLTTKLLTSMEAAVNRISPKRVEAAKLWFKNDRVRRERLEQTISVAMPREESTTTAASASSAAQSQYQPAQVPKPQASQSASPRVRRNSQKRFSKGIPPEYLDDFRDMVAKHPTWTQLQYIDGFPRRFPAVNKTMVKECLCLDFIRKNHVYCFKDDLDPGELAELVAKQEEQNARRRAKKDPEKAIGALPPLPPHLALDLQPVEWEALPRVQSTDVDFKEKVTFAQLTPSEVKELMKAKEKISLKAFSKIVSTAVRKFAPAGGNRILLDLLLFNMDDKAKAIIHAVETLILYYRASEGGSQRVNLFDLWDGGDGTLSKFDKISETLQRWVWAMGLHNRDGEDATMTFFLGTLMLVIDGWKEHQEWCLDEEFTAKQLKAVRGSQKRSRKTKDVGGQVVSDEIDEDDDYYSDVKAKKAETRRVKANARRKAKYWEKRGKPVPGDSPAPQPKRTRRK